MILWSKGLGKLVLRMSLDERYSAEHLDEKIVIDGTMGPPTHWDYSVTMNEEDVLDMVELLEQPAPIRFVVEGETKGLLIRTALVSGVVFAWNTIRCFLGVPRIPPPPKPRVKAAVDKAALKKAMLEMKGATKADRS